MSREIRRVPVDWKHPTEPNPHWMIQHANRMRRGAPESRLLERGEKFVCLMGDYPGALARWQEDRREITERTGHGWEWNLAYHLTGYQGHADTEPVAHPVYMWGAESDEVPVRVLNEDHLQHLLLANLVTEEPNPAEYMPVFDVPVEQLGWCLYETVSEGSPVTPVFATADELVEHLATVGQDWDQEPMRRAAAEQLVRMGHSFGSLVVAGGTVYRGDHDADLIAGGLR